MKNTLIGQATPEQITEWKKQYGEVIKVVTENSVCYLKKASRQTVRAAMSFVDKDKVRYAEVMIENCWLGGDERFKKEDAYFFSLMDAIPELTEVKKAEIKKL